MLHVIASLWPWGSTNLGDWSNFLSPLEGIGAFSAGYVLYRKHNCHVKGCPRIGRHPVHGTPFITCAHHHPHQGRVTQDVVNNAHALHMQRSHGGEIDLTKSPSA